jgi:hypothetical protein
LVGSAIDVVAVVVVLVVVRKTYIINQIITLVVVARLDSNRPGQPIQRHSVDRPPVNSGPRSVGSRRRAASPSSPGRRGGSGHDDEKAMDYSGWS